MLMYIEKPEGGVRVETDYGLDLKGTALPENESVIATNSGGEQGSDGAAEEREEGWQIRPLFFVWEGWDKKAFRK